MQASTDRPLFLPGAPTPALLTTKQAAYLLSTGEATVCALVKSGLLRTKQHPGTTGRDNRITLESLTEYARAL